MQELRTKNLSRVNPKLSCLLCPQEKQGYWWLHWWLSASFWAMLGTRPSLRRSCCGTCWKLGTSISTQETCCFWTKEAFCTSMTASATPSGTFCYKWGCWAAPARLVTYVTSKHSDWTNIILLFVSAELGEMLNLEHVIIFSSNLSK